MVKKLAVLVGCNYPNTPNELHGCINDVVAMREMLITKFGFNPNDIEVLTDDPGSTVMPTGANISNALVRKAEKVQDGDVLFFQYSGHGTLIPSLRPFLEPHKRDEAIVPCDFNLITDHDFRKLVNHLPKGASFIFFSDSCHSGGLIAQEKEQIGPTSIPKTSTGSTTTLSRKLRFIPFELILQHLSSLTKINTADIGTHLLELFGSKASPALCLPGHHLDIVSLHEPDDGILLSGCQTDETSADVNPKENGGGGKAYGAFSNAIQMVLKEHQGPITNKELVRFARKVLQDQGVEQHPCLYCSDANADANFLLQKT